ncbi:MAG: exodeoxyribonuclease VII small subunit [Eubacterium sp.]|nr:exodeoxyribonuclease VII small subunit [Eubacterium sp.]
MDKKELTYEQAVARLEEIVSALEDNSVSLDKALELFEEGTKLTAFCTKLLNEAKQKITEIEKD